jgi:hypothetical protein
MGAGVRRWSVPLAGVLLTTGLAVAERLATALSAMHRASDVSARFGSVATPAALWSAPAVRELVRAWRDWDADRLAAGLAGQFVGPYWTVTVASLVDLLLVAAPLTLLLWYAAAATARRVARRPLPDWPVDGDRTVAVHRVARLAGWAALAYLGLTAVVDVATPLLVRFGDPVPLVQGIGLVDLLAWVALGCAVLPLAFADLATLRREGRRWLLTQLRVWLGWLVALRAQLVAAALLAALVFLLHGDLGLQIDDVAMRWIEDRTPGVLAVVGAAFASWLLLLSGEVCWYRHWQPRRPARPVSRRGLVVGCVLGLLVAAGGLVIVAVLHRSFGAVLVWPGAAVLLFSALSLPQEVHVIRPRPITGGPPTLTPPPAALPPAADAALPPAADAALPPAADAALPPAADAAPPALLWVAAAVPLGALGVIAARAAATLFVTQQPRAWWLLGVALLALAGAALMITSRVPSLPDRFDAGTGLVVAGGTTTAAGVAAGVWPIAVGRACGAIALLFLIVAGVTLVLSGLSLIGEAWTPPGSLALLGLRRVPAIAFFTIWFVVSSVVDQTNHYHDVRLAGPLPPGAVPVSAPAALNDWLDQHRAAPATGRRQVPMLFISASGGGIRAAYWTAMVLDCLFARRPQQPECAGDPLPREAVFVESGISGGSVGFAFDRALSGTGRAATTALSQDFISPDVAALGFRDAPLSWLHLAPTGVDRAAVLERAWEQAAGDPSPLRTGLFADARDSGGALRFPLLLLSGATVEDACQLNTSVLAAAPRPANGPRPPVGTDDCLSLTAFEPGRAHTAAAADPSALAAAKDLADYLCLPGGRTPHDLALSTAALLSARFPYVSPSGGLNGCGDPQRRTFDMDGGLIDSSGLVPLTELWANLAGDVQAINDNPDNPVCIQPRLIMIDNGYLPAAPVSVPSQPQELLAPIQGRSRATGQRSEQDEQAAALAFDHAFGTATCAGVPAPAPASRVAHLVPTARPGTQAPLGWSLSQFARDDLADQLDSPANRCEIQLVRSWFGAPPDARTGFCLTGFAFRHPGTAAGPPSLSTGTAPGTGDLGVAGVRLTVAGCVPSALTACSVTTDAAGRFNLLLLPDGGQRLRAGWGGATPAEVAVPEHPGFVDTSVNVLVGGVAPG